MHKYTYSATKNYAIIKWNGQDAYQLFDNAVSFVKQNYNNPNETIKEKTSGQYLKFEKMCPILLNTMRPAYIYL